MTISERNKQTVARVYDALRAGDVAALDDLIDEKCVQHNPGGGSGLPAIKDMFTNAGAIDVDVYRVVADGDLVAAHSHYKTWNMAGADFFRFNADGKMIEHWDVLQQVPDTTVSGNDMFTQLSP